ncbi:hypothetical protein GCM10010300_84180 [Streptomyces olivaceoviridis]|nr:hypothetical protein GCM10010300_84180 [Streptomyces olivaceoviridis]
MSEGYQGTTTKACGDRAAGRADLATGTAVARDTAEIPFLGHVLRVSGCRRDQLRARRTRRTAPDGWMRHA